MPVRFYVIPMEPGPYSRANPQRPQFLDAIQANWSGYPLFAWSRYLCQVNTTSAKHAMLDAQVGVISLPGHVELDTLVGNLPLVMRNRIQTFLANVGLAYDVGETVEALIRRVITTSEFQTFVDRLPEPGYIARVQAGWNPKRVYMDEF